MKILILGATGFIGRNMIEHFSSDSSNQVTATYNHRPSYENEKIRWVKCNLVDSLQVHEIMQDVDVVIQAAATTSGSKDIVNKPYIHTTDNAVMNSYIFRAAAEAKVKNVIFFSCTVMYPSSIQPLRETDLDLNVPLHERYFGVGWTKMYLEKMAEFYADISDTKFTVIRHSNIYGPHDKFDLEKSHVMGATITKVLSALEGSSIQVWGTGDEERDLLYVEDLTSFVEKAIKRQDKSFSLLNCGYGTAISIKALVQKIIKLSGKDLSVEHDLSQPTIKTSLSLNCEKAKEDIGWEPSISLDEGIEKTITWWNKNIK
jgi:nucleoside-diphosphate-sugar epimerase